MGNFKKFLLTEQQMGLGNLGASIDTFVHSQYLDNIIGGAFASSDVTGTEQPQNSAGHPLHLPSTDVTIPSIERSGRITFMALKRNPIYVRLSDGTEAHFTYEEYKRIEGEPEVGKVMTIVFQRHPNDLSKMGSKIDKAIVTD